MEAAMDTFQGYTFHFEWEVVAQEWLQSLIVVGFVAPFLVGLSRVMLGAHYITDVLVGWALGALVIFLVSYLQRRVKREWLLHLVIAIVCIPGFFYCQTADYYISYGMMIGFFLANAFEKRFVNFKSTRSVVRGILRLLGGATLYFGLNALFKYICELILSEAFLASASFASFAIITVRYAIIMFLIIGIYPLAFDRIGTPKPKE